MKRSDKYILAVASGGGHWVELMRIRPAFGDARVAYVTVRGEYHRDVDGARLYQVNDATRWSPLAVIFLAVRILWIVLRERPDVIVTTGAAPGYFAVRFGRWVRARTIWIDSIANAEQLSMSGRIAGRFVDLWLTQWPHLASSEGPEFAGAVL